MLERIDAITNEVLEPITFVLAYPTVFQCMLERTDALTNEVLEPITFVLAYPTIYIYTYT
jgi:hypothetical protein